MNEESKIIIKEFQPDVAMLTEAGFVALKQVDEIGAMNCFCAAMAANPKEPLPLCGIGMVHMFKLELDEACKIFEHVLENHPKDEAATSLLGVCKMFMLNEKDMKDGENMMRELMKSSKDPAVKQLTENFHLLRDEIKAKMKDLHPLEAGKKQGSPLDRLKK